MDEQIVNAISELIKISGNYAVWIILVLQIKYFLGFGVLTFIVWQIRNAIRYAIKHYDDNKNE